MKHLKQKLVENVVGTIFLRPSVVCRAFYQKSRWANKSFQNRFPFFYTNWLNILMGFHNYPSLSPLSSHTSPNSPSSAPLRNVAEGPLVDPWLLPLDLFSLFFPSCIAKAHQCSNYLRFQERVRSRACKVSITFSKEELWETPRIFIIYHFWMYWFVSVDSS